MMLARIVAVGAARGNGGLFRLREDTSTRSITAPEEIRPRHRGASLFRPAEQKRRLTIQKTKGKHEQPIRRTIQTTRPIGHAPGSAEECRRRTRRHGVGLLR